MHISFFQITYVERSFCECKKTIFLSWLFPFRAFVFSPRSFAIVFTVFPHLHTLSTPLWIKSDKWLHTNYSHFLFGVCCCCCCHWIRFELLENSTLLYDIVEIKSVSAYFPTQKRQERKKAQATGFCFHLFHCNVICFHVSRCCCSGFKHYLRQNCIQF